eukprot:scaffold101747_cov45-Tisochrysis_lutea.AAC.2
MEICCTDGQKVFAGLGLVFTGDIETVHDQKTRQEKESANQRTEPYRHACAPSGTSRRSRHARPSASSVRSTRVESFVVRVGLTLVLRDRRRNPYLVMGRRHVLSRSGNRLYVPTRLWAMCLKWRCISRAVTIGEV